MSTQTHKLGILLYTLDLEETLESVRPLVDVLEAEEVNLYIATTQESISKELKELIKQLSPQIHIYTITEPFSESTIFNRLVTIACLQDCTHIWFIFNHLLLETHRVRTYSRILETSLIISLTNPWYFHFLFGMGKWIGFPYPQLTLPTTGLLINTKLFNQLGGLDESLFREHEVTDLILKAKTQGETVRLIKTQIPYSKKHLSRLFWIFTVKNHWIILRRYYPLLQVCGWMSLVGLKVSLALLLNRRFSDLKLVFQGYKDGIKTIWVKE